MRIGRTARMLATMVICGVMLAAPLFAGGDQEEAAAPEGPVTIEVRSVRSGQDWDLAESAIGPKFIEETGVNIKMVHSIGDAAETISLMIASGDLPDVVGPHYRLGPFVDAAMAMEITDLVEDNAPNLLEAYGPMWERMKYSPEDPGRYYLGNYYNGKTPERDPFPGDWYLLQHAVVMDQGYPELKTLEQFGNAIRAYKEKYPTINGQPTLGISFHLDIWVLNLHNPAMLAGGLTAGNNFLVDPDGTVTMHRRLPEHRPFYKWLNQMYNDGLVDPESFTQTKDQFEAKAASGRVLAFLGMGWQVSQPEQLLMGDGKPERTYGCYPVAAEGFESPWRTRGQTGLQTPQAEMVIPSTTSDQKALAFIQFMDYVASTEGQIMANWGIEGIHYDVVDGKRIMKSDVRERELSDANFATDTGINLLSGAPFPHYTAGVKDPTGNYWRRGFDEDFRSQYPEIDKEVLDGYGVEAWQDLFLPADHFDFKRSVNVQQLLNQLPSEHPARLAYVTINDVSRKDLVNAIIAPVDEFDEMYDKYLEDLNDAGIMELEATATELARERLRFWGVLE